MLVDRMNSPGRENRGEAPVREEKPGLDVLLMYEDLSTGLRARRLLHEVMNSLNLEVDFQANLWRFDLLGEPALLELAADEAAKADIVFVSAHGQHDLPAAIHLWFNRWLARKGSEPCALAVVLDPNTRNAPARNRMLEAMGTVGGPAGVEVFVHAAEAPESHWESAVQDIHWRAETRTAVLEEILHRSELSSYRNWGINE
jgi:hypothetical protein